MFASRRGSSVNHEREEGFASKMQRHREARKYPDISDSRLFDDFGFPATMFQQPFGGRDPFDDPFFSRPFGSLFGNDFFSSGNRANLQQTNRPKGPTIQELDSDDEVLEESEENDINGEAWVNRNPLVDHPDDNEEGDSDNDGNKRENSLVVNNNQVKVADPETRSMSFQRVTYGGINGSYYTATTSRKTGNDGISLEESKQADRTTGEATHRISRGMHGKGHSVIRKLDPNGKVDTRQTLHNLNEDELLSFEQAWKGTDGHFLGRESPFGFPSDTDNTSNMHFGASVWGDFAHPLRKHSKTDTGKKIVRINIE